MTEAAASGGGRHEVLLEEGALSIRVAPPPGGSARDPSTIVVPDLSRLPGAHLVTQVAHDGVGWAFGAGCARAPSDRFVPGVEGVVFEKATWFTLRGAGLSPDELSVVRDGASGGVVEQDARGRVGDDALALRHVLTFAGPGSDVVVCSAVCRGPAGPCAEAVGSLAVEGVPAPPPAPGLLARALVGIVEHPVGAGVFLAVSATLLVVAWLRARPVEP